MLVLILFKGKSIADTESELQYEHLSRDNAQYIWSTSTLVLQSQYYLWDVEKAIVFVTLDRESSVKVQCGSSTISDARIVPEWTSDQSTALE